jgi:hypothetical protein
MEFLVSSGVIGAEHAEVMTVDEFIDLAHPSAYLLMPADRRVSAHLNLPQGQAV